MTTPTPAAMRLKRAAQELDMTPAQFRDLVARSILPGPVRIGEHERWLKRDLDAILSGDAMNNDEPEWG